MKKEKVILIELDSADSTLLFYSQKKGIEILILEAITN
jgi:hypothetical protein